MACLNTLKHEIRTLESIFPRTHDRFPIVSASVDELNCRFVGKNGKKYEIHANITVSTYTVFVDKVTLEFPLATRWGKGKQKMKITKTVSMSEI